MQDDEDVVEVNERRTQERNELFDNFLVLDGLFVLALMGGKDFRGLREDRVDIVELLRITGD